MTVNGTISGKMIELDEPSGLPDGSRVEVELRPSARTPLTREERVALVERTRGLVKATPKQVRIAMDEDLYGVD